MPKTLHTPTFYRVCKYFVEGRDSEIAPTVRFL